MHSSVFGVQRVEVAAAAGRQFYYYSTEKKMNISADNMQCGWIISAFLHAAHENRNKNTMSLCEKLFAFVILFHIWFVCWNVMIEDLVQTDV